MGGPLSLSARSANENQCITARGLLNASSCTTTTQSGACAVQLFGRTCVPRASRLRGSDAPKLRIPADTHRSRGNAAFPRAMCLKISAFQCATAYDTGLYGFDNGLTKVIRAYLACNPAFRVSPQIRVPLRNWPASPAAVHPARPATVSKCLPRRHTAPPPAAATLQHELLPRPARVADPRAARWSRSLSAVHTSGAPADCTSNVASCLITRVLVAFRAPPPARSLHA